MCLRVLAYIWLTSLLYTWLSCPGNIPYITLAHGILAIVTIRIFPSAHHPAHFRTWKIRMARETTLTTQTTQCSPGRSTRISNWCHRRRSTPMFRPLSRTLEWRGQTSTSACSANWSGSLPSKSSAWPLSLSLSLSFSCCSPSFSLTLSSLTSSYSYFITTVISFFSL